MRKPAVRSDIPALPKLGPEQVNRAVAVLLDWASCGGNEEISGTIVIGLVETLHLCADRLKAGRE